MHSEAGVSAPTIQRWLAMQISPLLFATWPLPIFVRSIPGIKLMLDSAEGTRLGNWLTREQAKDLLTVPDRSTLKGKRD